MRLSFTPRGTIPRMSTRRSVSRIPSRRSGTTSVPPASNRPLLGMSSTLDGRRSSTPLLLRSLAERAQHLLARDRQLVDVGTGRVANRIRDRRRERDDRRLAETLGAEARQMLVRLVDELAHDLRHVGDRRHAVRIERRREDAARLRIDQPLLRKRVADALDDAALDLTPRSERIDDATDIVGGGDTL